MRLSNRDPEDYLVEDPEVLSAYRELYGVDTECSWAEDIPFDVWVYLDEQEAANNEDEDETECT